MRRRGLLLGIATVAAVIVAVVLAHARSRDAPRPAGLSNFDALKSGVGRVDILTCAGKPLRLQGHGVTGTGFLVGSRVVMTAEHGVWVGRNRPACAIRVRFGDHTYPVTAVRVWSEHGEKDRNGIDLATLTLARPATGHVFAFAPKAEPLGNAVATIGYPLGGPLSVTRGKVTSYLTNFGRPALAAKIDIEGGNSGGPIVNDAGQVVSVVRGIVVYAFDTNDGSHRYGGVNLPQWWRGNARSDLCRTYPKGGIPGCDGRGGTPTKVAIKLRTRHA